MLIIVMTAHRPNILCRWCHSSKDTVEDEDEVVHGEVRYPDEIHSKSKYTHGTHMGNPLTHIEGDNDSSIIMIMSESTQIVYENLPHNLERSPVIKDNDLNKREASHTPNVPPYYGFDTMTKNESHHSGRVLATEHSNLELVEDSEKEANWTPNVPPYHGIYMNMIQNTTHQLDRITEEKHPKSAPTYEREANHTPSDHDTCIKMTRNPSYHLKKHFITDNDDVDCDKLMPTCIREAEHTLNVPMHYINDDDKVLMVRDPSYTLGTNFVIEGNFEETSRSSTASSDNDSNVIMTQNPVHLTERNSTKNNDANCVKTMFRREKEVADHFPDVPPRNIVRVTKTPGSNYSFIRNLFCHLRTNTTQDEFESVSAYKRKANHTLVAPPVYHESDDGIAMVPNPSYNVKENFFTETNSQQSFTCKRETGQIPDASQCDNTDSTNDGMIQNAACYWKGNRFEEASSFSSSQLPVAHKLEADSNPVIPQHKNDVEKSIKMSNINSHTVKSTENISCHFPKDFCN